MIRNVSRFLFLSVLVGSGYAAALGAQANTRFTLPTIGGVSSGTTPAELVRYLYTVGVWTGVFAAILALLIGGIVYVLAAGNPAKAQDAKDRIIHAVIGLLLILFSGAIVRLINPGLFNLQNPSLLGVDLPRQPVGAFKGLEGSSLQPYLTCAQTSPTGQGQIGTCTWVVGIPANDPNRGNCQTAGSSCQVPQPNPVHASCVAPGQSTLGLCQMVVGYCTDPRTGATLDPQCASCIGLSANPQNPSICTVTGPQRRPPPEIVDCVNRRTSTSCNDLSGGFRGWTEVPSSVCLSTIEPVRCSLTGERYNPMTDRCCVPEQSVGRIPQLPSSQFSVRCVHNTRPPTANVETRFSIEANGSGAYVCEWSSDGDFRASGCSPRHTYPLPGQYRVTVRVTDTATGQQSADTCLVNIGGPRIIIKNRRTDLSGDSDIRFCPHDPWRLEITNAVPEKEVWLKYFKDGEVWYHWKVYQPLTSVTGSWAINEATPPPPDPLMRPYQIGSWEVRARIAGVEANVLRFEVKPCMIVRNPRTRRERWSTQGTSDNFYPFCAEEEGDIEILGTTSTEIFRQRWFDRGLWEDWRSVGTTDAREGRLFLPRQRFTRCHIGDWEEQIRLYYPPPPPNRGPTPRFSEMLRYTVNPCLAAECTIQGSPSRTIFCGTLQPPATPFPSYTIEGRVWRALSPPVVPTPLPGEPHECRWDGPGPVFPLEPPSQSYCQQTRSIGPREIAPGTHAIRIEGRYNISACPNPRPRDQEWAVGACTLTVQPVCRTHGDCNDGMTCTADFCEGDWGTCNVECKNYYCNPATRRCAEATASFLSCPAQSCPGGCSRVGDPCSC